MDKNSDILESLKELKNNSPYRVPDGYFDNLPERIRENIRQDSLSKKAKIIQIFKPWIGLAAGFLFIIVIYIAFFPKKTDMQIAANSSLLYESYDETLDPLASQLSEYDLTSYLSGEDINDEYSDPLIETDVSDFTIEDIEDLILF